MKQQLLEDRNDFYEKTKVFVEDQYFLETLSIFQHLISVMENSSEKLNISRELYL